MNTRIDMKRINRCLRWLANETVEFYEEKQLPNKLSTRVTSFYNSVSDLIQWDNLTQEDVTSLGFLNWEADQSGVWFIPKWLFPVIPEGTVLYDRNFNRFEFKRSTASKETMYGCLTFGVILSNETEGE